MLIQQATDLSGIGIYQIRNLENGKIYIGKTEKPFRRRFNEHRNDLKKKKHINIHLQRAYERYGENTFVFEAIEICGENDDLYEKERKWILQTESYLRHRGYNIALYDERENISTIAEPHVTISPEGKIYDVASLKKFCALKRLCYRQMRKVRDGEALHHKMWRCYKSSEIPDRIDTPEELRMKVEYAQKHKLDAAIKAHTGSYTIYDPEGKIYETNHLPSFCENHGLLYVDMTEVAKGKKYHHKKWRCYRVGVEHPTHEEFLETQKKRKLQANKKRGIRNVCELISPHGKTFMIKNLKEFCGENNLVYSSMNAVVNGHKKSNKGWTGRIIDVALHNH